MATDTTSPSAMSDEMRIALYAAAREELLERIRLRDQSLFAYVVLLGGYFGFALALEDPSGTGLRDWREILSLFALPAASVIFTLIVLQHHIQISQIARYLSEDLLSDLPGRHWDAWCAANSPHIRTFSRRWAQTLILAMPSCYVVVRLGIAWRAGAWSPLATALGLFSLVAVALILWWNLSVERLRRQNDLLANRPVQPDAAPADPPKMPPPAKP